MKLYKLTKENDRTFGDCQWGEGVTVETSGGGELCGPGWTHWTTDPLLAVLLNPCQGDYNLETAHLWEGEGEVRKTDHGLKVGCTKATTVKRIPLPIITMEMKIEFAIRCSLRVCQEPNFVTWANGWIRGTDRAAQAARAAAAAARAARAAEAAARAVARAAEAAAMAAARAAARAAEAAAWAAEVAARAAGAAAEAAGEKGMEAENVFLAEIAHLVCDARERGAQKEAEEQSIQEEN